MVGASYRAGLVRRSPVAVVAAVAAVAGLGLGACGGDDGSAADQRAQQARDAATEAGLPDEVADVLALAASAVDATYHVAYDLAADGSTPARRVAVTQRGADRRIDVVTGDTTDATILVDGSTYQCRQAEGSWSCATVVDAAPPTGAFDPAAVAQATEALTAATDTYDFAVEHRTLLGLDATCLVTTRKDGAPVDPTAGESGTLCLSAEGAVLLAERTTERLEAVEYGTDVADDAFALPAHPTPAGTPGG